MIILCRFLITTCFFLFFIISVHIASAAIYHIDKNHPNASDQNQGSPLKPFKTISKANEIAIPGDTFLIKEGNYSSYIAPNKSGTKTQPIIYKNYESDKVQISNTQYGISLNSKSYIHIVGISFQYLDKFVWLQNRSTHNIISFCNFKNGRNIGWSGSKIYRNSSYNWIHHCSFSNYGFYTDNDIGSIIDVGNEENQSDTTSHNLIEHNVMSHGGHHVMGVYGMFNVIRNNLFHNEPWAMGTNSSDHGPILYGNRNLIFAGYPNNSGRNLFENNRVGFSSDPPDNRGASGLALTTAHNILRFNQFYHNNLAGISMSLTRNYYSDIIYNKIYHNAFFHNGINKEDPNDHMNSGIGFGLYSGNHIIRQNSIKNNILYAHRVPFGSYKVNLEEQIFDGNWNGDTLGNPHFIDATEILGDPKDNSSPDLNTTDYSPCKSKGVPLTNITSESGSGKIFQVEDAGYFVDGWGIIEGDYIQLYGTNQRASITSIDYENNLITVSQALSWVKAQGVSLAYLGTSPDIGIYDKISEISTITIPSKPTNLKVLLQNSD